MQEEMSEINNWVNAYLGATTYLREQAIDKNSTRAQESIILEA